MIRHSVDLLMNQTVIVLSSVLRTGYHCECKWISILSNCVHFCMNKGCLRKYYHKFLGLIFLTTTGSHKLLNKIRSAGSLLNKKLINKCPVHAGTEEKWTKHSLRHPAHKTDGRSDKILESPHQGLHSSTTVSVNDICARAFVHACRSLEGHAHTRPACAVLLII